MNRVKIHSLNKVIASLLVMVISVLSFWTFCVKTATNVYADSNPVVGLKSDAENTINNPGDIITIDVTASNLTRITRFENLTIEYDSAQLDYLSINQPTILSAFTYNVDSSEVGILHVSAVNQTVEADIEEATLQGTDFEDNSFSSDEEIVVFSISFRVLPASSEAATLKITDPGIFVDSSKKEMAASLSVEELAISVTEEPSSDSNLAFLTINGYTLTPEFSSDIYDYSIMVSREEMSVQVSAIPVNLWASVDIVGNNNLEDGDNLISIEVTAQDKITKSVYTIHVSKQETYTTDGAGLIENEGKIFTFVTFPTEYNAPDGFIENTKTINGYSVPVLSKDGVESVLVYLSDGSDSPDFYFYNPTSLTVIPYKPGKTSIITSRVLFYSKPPKGVKIPEGFNAYTLEVDNTEIEGYENEDGVFICYMVDELNNGGFYKYNFDAKTFTEYNSVSKSGTSIYKLFFHIFLFTTAFEAIIIVTMVLLLRHNIIKRKNPRPKRV